MASKIHITCTCCLCSKMLSKFPKAQLESATPICHVCISVDGKDKYKGLHVSIKRRKCANCGQSFRSVDDHRYCHDCKRNWERYE